MNRTTRNFAAVLLTVTTLIVFTPAAQARPLGKPQPVTLVTGSWIGAALSWLNQFLGAPQPAALQNAREKSTTVATSDGTTTNGTGFTGSCIDPNGCIVVERGNGGGGGK